MKIVSGFFMAWGNFCAIPCPYKKWDEGARKHMLVMFPVIGLVIGVLWWALYSALALLNIPNPLAAAVLTAYPFLVSGFIHLDGFMDCNDAILSRRPLEERQRILKDSHVGAFAVITVILLFMMVFASMWSILEAGSNGSGWCLIAIPVLARAIPARDIMTYRPLTTSQYDKSYDEKENQKYKWGISSIWLAASLLLIGGGCLAACHGYPLPGFLQVSVIMVLMELAAGLISGAYARKQLGGMSGDIAGYTLVWGELAAVAALAVM